MVFCEFGLSLHVDHLTEMPLIPEHLAVDIQKTEGQISLLRPINSNIYLKINFNLITI